MNHLSWDLCFDGDAIGVSTFGDGAADVPRAIGLMQGWYMAVRRMYPEDFAEHPFKGFWLGEFYSVEDELEFTSHMYDYLGTHFTHLDPAPEYRVFLRLDTPPLAAQRRYEFFMLSRGPSARRSSYSPPRQTFAEMLHQWVGGRCAAGDITWFIEGLTTYYEYTLPFAPEVDQTAYIDGLNHLSTIYYQSGPRDVCRCDRRCWLQ